MCMQLAGAGDQKESVGNQGGGAEASRITATEPGHVSGHQAEAGLVLVFLYSQP